MPVRKERRDYQENRKIILQSAQELFDEHGIDNVSMRQIALQAGVGQGTLYRRYAHKGELCLDVMRESMGRFNVELQSYLYESKELNIHQKLEKVIELLIDYMECHSQNLGGIKAPDCEQSSFIFNNPLYQNLHAVLSGLIREASQEKEELVADPDYSADAIIAMLTPHLYIYQRTVRGYSKEEIRVNMVRIFL